MTDNPTPGDLEREFRRLQRERMRDMPFVNPALEVAAVGFRSWLGYDLGVMLTPWFMNLVLLPGRHEPWPELRIGDARSFSFPSGTYEFLLNEQIGIGRFLACSLFSPVFEFGNQTTALATAQAVMDELFNEKNRQQPTPGEPLGIHPEAFDDRARSGVSSIVQGNEKAVRKRLSRRDFLRGKTQSSSQGVPFARESRLAMPMPETCTAEIQKDSRARLSCNKAVLTATINTKRVVRP